MAVDYFLIEGPSAIPLEFQQWWAAYKAHTDYFLANVDNPPPDFEERGQALGRKAAALEETARAAFLLWLMRRNAGVAAAPARVCPPCVGDCMKPGQRCPEGSFPDWKPAAGGGRA